MYYSHHQTNATSSSTLNKHHDAPPNGNGLGVGLGGGGGGGGGGGWGRHNFTPSALPLPSPGGYPNGLAGYGGPGPNGGGPGGPGGPGQHHPHHGNMHHPGGSGSHPHHPTFGGGGPQGLHLGQNGVNHGQPGFGMGLYNGGQGGSPPRSVGEPQVPLTAFWQHQLLRAETSRVSSSPHHRARTAAMASRLTNKPLSVTISDPNRPSSSASNPTPHKKTTSLTVMTSLTPEMSEPSTTPGLNNADPATPAQAPAPTKDDTPVEPWTGLDLGGIRLKTLSTAMFSFSHITSLYINHNALTSLPAAISNLRHLTLLDATANELATLPPELGVLCKLKELLVFDNHLTTLPAELGTLYQLETIGIDGNPLEERLKKIVADEGTTALITHLRDTCPVGPAPPERQWIEIEPDSSSPSAGKQESFTVLTYNILCHSFAPGSTYSYTPSWALDWGYRKQTILQEIINASADVVCLQEIDGEQYADYFYPQLKQHGYEGCHFPRTRARTMQPEEAKMVDGCCTFWKDDRFSLVETQVVEFNQVALQKTDMRTDDMFNRVMSRDNIAVVATLEFSASGARLLVCNSHIYWDHRYRDVKLVQTGMLMEELEKIAERFSHLPPKPPSGLDSDFNHGRGPPKYEKSQRGTDIPIIMCVDLNSLADSAVYDFLSTGEIQPGHEDFMTHLYGPYTQKGLRHRLNLKSACSSFGEMRMTNFTPTFVAAIDYIFYSPRALKVTSVLGDVDKGYLDKVVGFPNAHFPSDHIPVFAQFRVKGQSESPSPTNHIYTR